VEEKLFVNCYQDRPNVSRCKKRTNQRCGSRCRCRAQVCRLANLASRLVLSLGVGVRQGLGNKKNGQDRQGESKNPHPLTSRLVPMTHRWLHTTPIFPLTPEPLPGEQHPPT
jgi:hypothetical protein